MYLKVDKRANGRVNIAKTIINRKLKGIVWAINLSDLILSKLLFVR